jgi:hypothetical protein
MIAETIFIVSLSVFAVFGIHCSLRILAESLFAVHYPAAVYAEADADPEEVMFEVKSANRGCLCGKCGVIVLVEGENYELIALLENAGVRYARIKQGSQESVE